MVELAPIIYIAILVYVILFDKKADIVNLSERATQLKKYMAQWGKNASRRFTV